MLILYYSLNKCFRKVIVLLCYYCEYVKWKKEIFQKQQYYMLLQLITKEIESYWWNPFEVTHTLISNCNLITCFHSVTDYNCIYSKIQLNYTVLCN